MTYLKSFFANLKASPKTSAAGIAGVVGCITAAVHDPGKLGDAGWWTVLFVSGGLLFSGDAGKQEAPKA